MGQDLGRMIGGGGGESGSYDSYYLNEEEEDEEEEDKEKGKKKVFRCPRALGGVISQPYLDESIQPSKPTSDQKTARIDVTSSSSSSRTGGFTHHDRRDGTPKGDERTVEAVADGEQSSGKKENLLESLDLTCFYLLLSYLYMNDIGKLCLVSCTLCERILTIASLINCKGLVLDKKVRDTLGGWGWENEKAKRGEEQEEKRDRGKGKERDLSTRVASLLRQGGSLLQLEISEMLKGKEENRKKEETDSSYSPHLSHLTISFPSSCRFNDRGEHSHRKIESISSSPSSFLSLSSSSSSLDLLKNLLEFNAPILQTLWITSSSSSSSSSVSSSSSERDSLATSGGGGRGGEQEQQHESHQEDLVSSSIFPFEHMPRLEEIRIIGRRIDPIWSYQILRDFFCTSSSLPPQRTTLYLDLGPSTILLLHGALRETSRLSRESTHRIRGEGRKEQEKDIKKVGTEEEEGAKASTSPPPLLAGTTPSSSYSSSPSFSRGCKHLYINLGGYEGNLMWLVNLLDGLQEIYDRQWVPHLEGTLIAKTSLLSLSSLSEEEEDENEGEEEISSGAVSTRDGTIEFTETSSAPISSSSSVGEKGEEINMIEKNKKKNEEEEKKNEEKENHDGQGTKSKRPLVDSAAFIGDGAEEERREDAKERRRHGGEEEEHDKKEQERKREVAKSTLSDALNEKILLYAFWMPYYTRISDGSSLSLSRDRTSTPSLSLREKGGEEQEEREGRRGRSKRREEEEVEEEERRDLGRKRGEKESLTNLYPPNDSLTALSPQCLTELSFDLSAKELLKEDMKKKEDDDEGGEQERRSSYQRREEEGEEISARKKSEKMKRYLDKCIYASFCSLQKKDLFRVYKRYAKLSRHVFSMPAICMSTSFYSLLLQNRHELRRQQIKKEGRSTLYLRQETTSYMHALQSTQTLLSAFDRLVIDIPLERFFLGEKESQGNRHTQGQIRHLSSHHEGEIMKEKSNLLYLLGERNFKKISGFQLDLTNDYLQETDPQATTWDVHTLQQKILAYIRMGLQRTEDEKERQ
ncbi:hypothetical protein CSUI_011129, partial [Cystoisospora suis]